MLQCCEFVGTGCVLAGIQGNARAVCDGSCNGALRAVDRFASRIAGRQRDSAVADDRYKLVAGPDVAVPNNFIVCAIFEIVFRSLFSQADRANFAGATKCFGCGRAGDFAHGRANGDGIGE